MSSDHNSGGNQRAYVRQSLSLEASLITDSSASIPVKIRDFCPGGVFLAIDPNDPISAAIHYLNSEDQADINFSVSLDGSSQSYTMQISIARVFEAGIGAAFVKPAQAALLALATLAEQQKAEATLSRSELTGEKNTEVIAETWKVAEKHLKAMMSGFFQQADEKLFIAARDATNNVQQTEYFTCMNVLKKTQPTITGFFEKEIKAFYEQTGESGTPQDFSARGQSDELSLIDKDDFEDLLTASEIVSRAEPRYSKILDRVEVRLSQLFNTRMERGTNPLGVSAITSAFSNAKDQVDLSDESNELLFAVYEEAVIPRLEFFYRDLDEVLKKYFKLPEKKEPEPKARKTPPRPTRQIDELVAPLSNTQDMADSVDLGEAQQQAPGPAQQPSSPAQQPSSPAQQAPGLSHPASATHPSAGQQVSAPVADHPATEQGTMSPAGAENYSAPSGQAIPQQPPAYPSAQQPVSNQVVPRVSPDVTMRAMQNLMNIQQGQPLATNPAHSPVAPANGPATAGAAAANMPASADSVASAPQPSSSAQAQPAGVPQQYASDDIIEALSLMQQESQSGWKQEVGNENNISRLKRILKSRVGGGESLQINQAHSNALNMADKFLSSFEVDNLVGSGVKSRLSQMQGTIQKLAIKDGEFLTNESHPARAVLNQIADLKAAGDEKTGEQLDNIVQRINQNFDKDSNVFADVMPEITELASQQQERYNENVEQIVGDLKQQQEFLRKRRGGKSTEVDPLANADKQPGDWRLWLERAMKMQVGDLLAIKKADDHEDVVTLVWIGDNYNPYVFVDTNGNKALSMTLQELAMQLRRGTATLQEMPTLAPVDRAMRTTLYKMHDEIGQQANNEVITGLPNRRSMMEKIKQEQLAVEQTDKDAVLVEVNFDCVAAMNRKFGEEAADDLLKALGDFMRGQFTQHVLACLGGDRFSLLFSDCDKQAAEQRCQSLLEEVKTFRFRWGEQVFTVGVSIGLLSLKEVVTSVEKLLDEVTGAAANARKQGKNQVYVFSPDDTDTGLEEVKKDWRALVDKVVESDSLKLRSQRVVPVGEGGKEKPHLEILLGIEDEEGNLIPQEDFMLAANLNEQAPAVDRLLIRDAMRWMFANKKSLKQYSMCAINISELTLRDEKTIEYIIGQLTESRVPAGKVCFEMSQTVVIENRQIAERFIRTMKEFGCKFSMDGFGRGDTAQGYLSTLPIDYLKMDGLFVRGMHKNPNDLALVKSMNEIGHLMGKKTIAEQVNNEKNVETLKEIGVDYIQGLAVCESESMEEVA